MARSSFKHFFTPDTLAGISTHLWFRFLCRHKADVERNGMQLPDSAEGWVIDFEKLSRIINVADDATSPDLHQALYFIHEMADADSMSLLIDAIGWEALSLSENGSDSCADIAVRAWLANPDALKRKHAEKRIANRRSYRYFFTDQEVHDPGVSAMTEARLTSIATLIAEDCDKRFKREDGARTEVYPFVRNGELWLMVRRGEPFARKMSIKDGKSAITAYRPLAYEVAIISASNTEIRINASAYKRIETYRQVIGERLFVGADYFSRENRYSLEPLRMLGKASLLWSEDDGIADIRLTELEYLWGGPERETELRSSSDLFKTLERRGQAVHPRARIGKAKFEVKFRDTDKARSVVIQPPNKLVLTRDTDAHAIDTWLTSRGFVRPPQSWRVKPISGFWRSFEQMSVLAGTMKEWRSFTGEDASHLRHLLVPTKRHASAVVDEKGVEYTVVKHDDGDFALVDGRDGAVRPVAGSELIVYEINHAALHAALSDALGIDGQPTPIEGSQGAIQLGFLRPYAGYEFRAIFACSHEPAQVQLTIEALLGRYGERIIVLLPSAAYRSPTMDSLLMAKHCCLLTLEDKVELREDGTFELTDEGEEALTTFVDAALPAIGTRDESGMAAFRTPAKAKWGDVRIEFKDGESVSVKVKKEQGVFLFNEMGMANLRNQKPTKQWELLKTLSTCHGFLHWGNRAADKNHQKQMQTLNDKLKRFFKIEGESIEWEDKGYKTRFHIKPCG